MQTSIDSMTKMQAITLQMADVTQSMSEKFQKNFR